MQVEFAASFWEDAVRIFDETRGPNSEAALYDFRSLDLSIISDAIVENWSRHIRDGDYVIAFVPARLMPLYMVRCIEIKGTARAVGLEVDPEFVFPELG